MNRPLRSLLASALFAIAWLPPLSGDRRPPTATTVVYDGSTIRIKTFIEISGPQATPALATVIEAEINRVWQDPANAHDYCGIPVEFEAEVRVQEGFGTEGWHQIWIHPLRPGQYFRDYVEGGNLYSGDVGGEWGPFNATPANRNRWEVYAHEAGHLFGAPDEYIEGNGSLPGRDGSVMSDNIPWVDAYTVNNILQRATGQAQPPPPSCIRGTTYHEVTETDNGHERTGFLTLEVELMPGAEGEVRGTAVGEFTLAGIVEEGGCSFAYSTEAPIALDLVATGSGSGPYTIESELPIFIDEVQRHSLCSDPVDLVIEWEVSLDIPNVSFRSRDLGNGTEVGGMYHFEETTADRKVDVTLWQAWFE